jgi:hypothetical protein
MLCMAALACSGRPLAKRPVIHRKVIYASDISYLDQRCSSPAPVTFGFDSFLLHSERHASRQPLDKNIRHRLAIRPSRSVINDLSRAASE